MVITGQIEGGFKKKVVRELKATGSLVELLPLVCVPTAFTALYYSTDL